MRIVQQDGIVYNGEPGIWIREDDPEPEAPAPTYEVRILHRDRAEDWHWHPYVVGRVIDFIRTYDRQGDPTALVRNIQQSFVMDDPGLILLAFFRDEALIGHILCDRSMLYHAPLVVVHQYALDHGIPPHIRHESVDLMKAWGRSFGATYLQWLVRDKRLVPLYKRTFGAKAHLLLMRMDIGEA
jgi:hypothetical protein